MLLPPHRRRSLFDSRILAAYTAGTTAGALVAALVAWLVSGFTEPLSPGVRLAVIGLGVLLATLARHGGLDQIIRLPETRRQIPAEIFGGSVVRGAFLFGFELGTGVRTYVSSVVPYFLALVVLVGRLSLADSIAAGIGFGIGRALPLAAQLVAPTLIAPFTAGDGPGRRVADVVLGLVVLAGGFALVDRGF